MRYGDVATWALDPRGVVRYKLTERVKLKLASGLFAQPPLPFQIMRDAGNPQLAPDARVAELGRHRDRAADYARDREHAVLQPRCGSSRAGPAAARSTPRATRVGRCFTDDGKGRAYGFELLLRRRVRARAVRLALVHAEPQRALPRGRAQRWCSPSTRRTCSTSRSATHRRLDASARASRSRPAGRSATCSTPRATRAVYDTDEDDFDPDCGRAGACACPRTTSSTCASIASSRLGPIEASVYLDVINVYNAPNSEGYQYEYDFSRRGRCRVCRSCPRSA